jgi:hypothetical protein
MRLPQMTTRRWMIAVAVVGLLLGTAVMGRRLKQRRDYCLQQARNQAWIENHFCSMESRLASNSPPQRFTIISDGHIHQADSVAAYFAERKEFYLHAASRPWLSVPPDQRRETVILESDSQTIVHEGSGRGSPAELPPTRSGSASMGPRR